MSERLIALDQLIARMKANMQVLRRTSPFFQLEQQAARAEVPRPLPRLLPSLLPELAPAGPDGLALPLAPLAQLACCPDMTALIVNIETCFHHSSPELIAQVRQAAPTAWILAHDWVVDEYQILQARLAGADGLTLSPALLGPRRTQMYVNKARFWELEPVLQIHTPEDFSLARELRLRVLWLNAVPGQAQEWSLESLPTWSLGEEVQLLWRGQEPVALRQSGVRVLTPALDVWRDEAPQALWQRLQQQCVLE